MEQNKKSAFIRTGDFFFKYRNLLFPLLLVTLFVVRPPSYEYWGLEWLEGLKDVAAALIVLAGLALRASVIGFAYIKRGGLNKQVYADKLVTEGFFGVCRNPLYVGNFIIYFGVLLMHGSPLVIVLGMAFFGFVYSAIVAAEEYFLRGKFGEEFTAYCREVPRWGFKMERFRQATQDMEFSLKRVIAKDYTTMTNAIIALAAIEFMEEVIFYPEQGESVMYVALLSVIAVMIFAAVFIRKLKKRGLLSA